MIEKKVHSLWLHELLPLVDFRLTASIFLENELEDADDTVKGHCLNPIRPGGGGGGGGGLRGPDDQTHSCQSGNHLFYDTQTW